MLLHKPTGESTLIPRRDPRIQILNVRGTGYKLIAE